MPPTRPLKARESTLGRSSRPVSGARWVFCAVLIAAFTWSLAGSNRDGAHVANAVGDPVIAAVGDIACDPTNSNFNAGNGTSENCRQRYTSDLVFNAGLAAVLPLGDNQYYCGGYNAFLQSYDLSWGRVKSITHPAVGNHEYLTSGGTDCNSANAGAAGHFRYYGAAAGTPGQGYYSFDVGTWHLIALNSSCGDAGGCSPSSPQGQWLQADLDSHQNMCTLAFWHIPLFSSGGRASSNTQSFWNVLYAEEADLILAGHDHTYERFAPQTPTGALDNARGIRSFVVGSGGANHTSFVTTAQNSEVRNDSTFGVLKLTLHENSYDWVFQPEAGAAFTDSGTSACHGPIPDNEPPSAPTNLTATAVGGSRVNLAWTASTDNVAVIGYEIYRGGTLIGTSSTASYTDLTVQPNTTYSYQVRAYDQPGNRSPFSNTAIVTTGPPDEVLTFAPVDDTYILSGSPNASFGTQGSMGVDLSPEANMLLKFAVSGIGPGRTVVSATLRLHCVDPSTMGGAVRRAAHSSWSEQSVTWNTAPAGEPTSVDSLGSVTVGNWYGLNVSPLVTGDGPVSFRMTSSSTNGADYATKEGAAGLAPQLVLQVAGSPTPDTEPPTRPSGLSATANSSTRIDLAWTGSTDNVGVTGYRIYRDGSLLTTVGATPTSYSDTTVADSTTYTYTVSAIDAMNNESPQSDPASATTPPPDTEPPTAPSGLSATAVSSTRIDLAWTGSTDNVGVT
ncbi:MAG: DNRLRE domain-containing protein, partial [Actinomycetota bacterium]